MKKVTVIILLLLTLSFTYKKAFGEAIKVNEEALRVLFIGNSLIFTGELDIKLRDIAQSKGKNLKTGSIAKAGYSLYNHWVDKKLLTIIEEGNYDFVVLQEHGSTPLANKEEFYQYSTLFDEKIKASGAKTVFYITARSADSDGKATADRQKPLNDSYIGIANTLGALIAPGGPAWVEFNKIEPDVGLYQSDKLHLNTLGGYITACCIYSVIFNESPEGASDECTKSDSYYSTLNSEEKKELLTFIHRIAWDTVTQFNSPEKADNSFETDDPSITHMAQETEELKAANSLKKTENTPVIDEAPTILMSEEPEEAKTVIDYEDNTDETRPFLLILEIATGSSMLLLAGLIVIRMRKKQM